MNNMNSRTTTNICGNKNDNKNNNKRHNKHIFYNNDSDNIRDNNN